jgi:hypothetical protein
VVVGPPFHDGHGGGILVVLITVLAAPLIALLSGEGRTAVGDETEPAESAEQVQ